jgi:histidinol-phosphate/aromatic aminotransferase/cobyric acid decarboxylase-like protein
VNRPVHGGNLAWAAAIANCPTSSIVDFSASINPLGPPQSAIAAIQRGFQLLNAYPDPNYKELSSALAQWHQISPEYLLPGNGSAELLTWACRELAELESTYLVTPAFSDYRRGLKAFGAKVLDCPFIYHSECNEMERSIWGDSSLPQNDTLELKRDSSLPLICHTECNEMERSIWEDSSSPQNDNLRLKGDSSLPLICHSECNEMERSIWEDSSLPQNDTLELKRDSSLPLICHTECNEMERSIWEDSSLPQNDNWELEEDSSSPQNDTWNQNDNLNQNDSLENILNNSCSPFPVPRSLLLNNPHNPTGKLWSQEEILPLLDRFALVVIDEAFMDFLPPSQQQSLISYVAEFKNLVILRSLTKFYSLPGLRLGYAIAHPDRLKLWQQWRDPWTVNILAAVAAEAIIGDREFQEKTLNWLPVAREELFLDLSAIEGLQPLPSAANFLLIKTEKSSIELQEKLLKNHRILIRDCLSFPELGDRYFRIAVRSRSDNKHLVEALKVEICNI